LIDQLIANNYDKAPLVAVGWHSLEHPWFLLISVTALLHGLASFFKANVYQKTFSSVNHPITAKYRSVEAPPTA
jgi:hypothetical protein